MRDSRWDMKFLGMQIMVEGLALGSFGTIYRGTKEPLLKQLLKMVIQDEARHVHYGVVALREHITKALSESERREREDWAFEVALLMRNRFLMYELYEEKFQASMTRAEWRETVLQSPGLEEFRTVMFSRLVPNLREIGLLSPRIIPHYEKVGLMKYFGGLAANRISGEQMIREPRRRVGCAALAPGWPPRAGDLAQRARRDPGLDRAEANARHRPAATRAPRRARPPAADAAPGRPRAPARRLGRAPAVTTTASRRFRRSLRAARVRMVAARSSRRGDPRRRAAGDARPRRPREAAGEETGADDERRAEGQHGPGVLREQAAHGPSEGARRIDDHRLARPCPAPGDLAADGREASRRVVCELRVAREVERLLEPLRGLATEIAGHVGAHAARASRRRARGS